MRTAVGWQWPRVRCRAVVTSIKGGSIGNRSMVTIVPPVNRMDRRGREGRHATADFFDALAKGGFYQNRGSVPRLPGESRPLNLNEGRFR